MGNCSVLQVRPALAGRRVIVFFNNLDLGGAERQGLVLARHLAREERAAVEVWGFSGPGPVAELCDEAGIPWRVAPFQWSGSRLKLLVKLFRLAGRLRRARPDVLLPYTLRPNVVCGALWKFSGARACIWQQRDMGFDRCPARLQRSAVRLTPRFIANSGASAAFLTSMLRVAPERIQVVHNGVVLTPAVEGRAHWRAKLGLRDMDVVACMVANLHDNKDHATLLRAWRLVIDRWSGRSAPVLLLAGRPENTTEKLKSLAFDLELQRAVRFLDAVRDVSGLLTAVDLCVFSSRSEGCPNGVLECMASGLPVAATDIPGIRDAVGADGLSFLAPPQDANGLADRIVRLFSDHELRNRIGQLNRQRIEREFSPQRMCRETVRLIEEVLGVPDHE
jgi:glycosyltransferase involved in cell wall biosynthesis